MPFREKLAWISAGSMLAVYGGYFAWVWRVKGVHLGVLVLAIVALVAVQVALTVVAVVAAPKEAQAPLDERERLIALRATRFAYSGLATGVAMACLFGAISPAMVFNTNALLFILVAAEVMRCGCQIVQYRREA